MSSMHERVEEEKARLVAQRQEEERFKEEALLRQREADEKAQLNRRLELELTRARLKALNSQLKPESLLTKVNNELWDGIGVLSGYEEIHEGNGSFIVTSLLSPVYTDTFIGTR